MINRVYKKLKRILTPRITKFDATGERVDILYKKRVDFDDLDMYQRSHYKRYKYAQEVIKTRDVCGDFACGTGYGSAMLAEKALKVIGADLNAEVITAIQKRYKNLKNVQFVHADLLHISYDSMFDAIISFETIEHFSAENILKLLPVFSRCLKPNGKLIISTPYLQEDTEAALTLGHHLTFHIDEKVIAGWLNLAGLEVLNFKYQNYDTHTIESSLEKKDFLICTAQKRFNA